MICGRQWIWLYGRSNLCPWKFHQWMSTPLSQLIAWQKPNLNSLVSGGIRAMEHTTPRPNPLIEYRMLSCPLTVHQHLQASHPSTPSPVRNAQLAAPTPPPRPRIRTRVVSPSRSCSHTSPTTSVPSSPPSHHTPPAAPASRRELPTLESR